MPTKWWEGNFSEPTDRPIWINKIDRSKRAREISDLLTRNKPQRTKTNISADTQIIDNYTYDELMKFIDIYNSLKKFKLIFNTREESPPYDKVIVKCTSLSTFFSSRM